jgi:hypothetical protein
MSAPAALQPMAISADDLHCVVPRAAADMGHLDLIGAIR